MKVSLYLIFALIFSFFTANVNATKFPSFNKHDMPAFAVGGQRDIMHIAEAQKRIDVRFVRLSCQRIAQEDDEIHFLSSDAGSYLLITAQRTRHHSLYL